jgi:hypothetical protein
MMAYPLSNREVQVVSWTGRLMTVFAVGVMATIGALSLVV